MANRKGAHDPLVKYIVETNAMLTAIDNLAPGENRDGMEKDLLKRVQMIEQCDPPRQQTAMQAAGLWEPKQRGLDR